MESVFLQILNMSITGSYVILAVLLIRLLLRRAPRRFNFLLWAVPAFRLICPVSFESFFSLFSLPGFDMTRAQSVTPTRMAYIPENIGMMAKPEITVGIPAANAFISSSLPAATPMYSANPMQIWTAVGSILWLAGVVVLLLWAIVSVLVLRHRMKKATRQEKGVWACENVRSPFILGIFRPRIYIPYGLSEDALHYVLAHERCHIRRLDHIIRPVSFLVLTLHWFNPLVWLGYILMGRDMEMSCDERVLAMEEDVRADYSRTLLTLAASRRFLTLNPLAFGETGVRQRIRNILSWKKPAVWITVTAVVVCLVVIFACAANPQQRIDREKLRLGAWETGLILSEEAVDALTELINSHRRTPYRDTGINDITDGKETKVVLYGVEGDVYTVEYRYTSGFSFDPRHFGEDDYQTILHYKNNDQGVNRCWTMEYDFDAKFTEWLEKFTHYGSSAPQKVTEQSVEDDYFAVVPYACLYMNPLSSFGAFGGDSGYRYYMTDSSFVIEPRNHFYAAQMIPVESWEWQAFPYTDEEWNALFVPEMKNSLTDINSRYDTIYYLPLGDSHFLLDVRSGDDSAMWLVETKENPQMGRYIWSIYSLAYEQRMGSAVWDYQPYASSRPSEFRFVIDKNVTEVSAFAEGGSVRWSNLDQEDGRAIYWSPIASDGVGSPLFAHSSVIRFFYKDEQGNPGNGSIYITCDHSSGYDKSTYPISYYTATVVGTNLYLRQDEEYGGGIIEDNPLHMTALP